MAWPAKHNLTKPYRLANWILNTVSEYRMYSAAKVWTCRYIWFYAPSEHSCNQWVRPSLYSPGGLALLKVRLLSSIMNIRLNTPNIFESIRIVSRQELNSGYLILIMQYIHAIFMRPVIIIKVFILKILENKVLLLDDVWLIARLPDDLASLLVDVFCSTNKWGVKLLKVNFTELCLYINVDGDIGNL